MTMRALDLFCGACGGWSLGFHRAGIETVAACEIDEWRRRQFSRNFPKVRMYDDVRNLTAARLRADGVTGIDIVCGSPPCQDASSANTTGRGIDGERTGLYLEAVRLVLEIRPRLYAFENVPGIRNRGIDRVLSRLEAGGYSAWPLVVGAVDLGAPHVRKRSWVVGADAETVQRLAQPWHQPDRNTERDLAVAYEAERREINRACGADGQYRDVRGPKGAGGFEAGAAPASDAQGVSGRPGFREGGTLSDGTVADNGSRQPIGAGLEGQQGERGNDGPQFAPLERAIAERCGAVAESWNGGIAGRIGVDDGLPKGMAQPLLSAYGDTVLPQVTEMIGRAAMQQIQHAEDRMIPLAAIDKHIALLGAQEE